MAVILSFLIHGAVFASGSAMVTQPVEYAMEAGGGIELHLVAALPQAAETVQSEIMEVQELPVIQEQVALASDEDVLVPIDTPEAAVPNPAPLVKAELPPSQATDQESTAIGDGSSPIPGKDATTLHSTGGAWSKGKPGYLRNPIPPYPEQAWRLGQEGLVILNVRIGKDGKPLNVAIGESSGFQLLDNSAVRTVKRWKFQPARVASMPIEVEVQLPIRFVLEDSAEGGAGQ